MKRLVILALAALWLAAALPAWGAGAKGEAPRISPPELKQMLGQAGVVVLDVRLGRDYRASQHKIARARREDPFQVEQWAANYDQGRTYVLY
jgi:rhodanese-related sulfurtransferase